MAPATDVRFLHVANGTSTTMTIEAAGIPGACCIWADPLDQGPVPAGLDDDELVDVRMRFLTTGDGAEAEAAATIDPVNDLREWRAAIARRETYDELLLWYEHDVFCQLNLIQLLTWIHDHLPRATPVSLICIDSFPGRPDFKGLGELTPEELASLFDTKQAVGDGQYDLARRAWQALREQTPHALDWLRREDAAALPYLAPAVVRFLQEYPWTRDGLSRSERRLLDLASRGSIALRDAFPQMDEGGVYYTADTSLAALAESLSHTSPPLVALDGPDAADRSDLDGVGTLTETGRSVLSGQQDRIAACGIDRWLGGVHLRTDGPVWRWDDVRGAIA